MCVHVCARPLAHLREDTPDMLPAASRKERERESTCESENERQDFPACTWKIARAVGARKWDGGTGEWCLGT